MGVSCRPASGLSSNHTSFSKNTSQNGANTGVQFYLVYKKLFCNTQSLVCSSNTDNIIFVAHCLCKPVYRAHKPATTFHILSARVNHSLPINSSAIEHVHPRNASDLMDDCVTMEKATVALVEMKLFIALTCAQETK